MKKNAFFKISCLKKTDNYINKQNLNPLEMARNFINLMKGTSTANTA